MAANRSPGIETPSSTRFSTGMTTDDLQGWRLNLGFTQADLAARLGVHTITVSRWERGETPIPPFLHLALWAIAHNAPH